MEPRYYREYFRNEREHWWFRARERILIGQLRRVLDAQNPETRRRVLNIGAATGRTSQWLANYGDVSSLEYDADCCELTRAALGLDIVLGSILSLPWPDQSFDIVCAFDVLEHIDDDKRAVAEMIRVARDGGLLFVTVPSQSFLWSEHDEINHHFRRYSLSELRSLFSGCDHIFSCGFNSVLFLPIAIHRLSRRALKRLFFVEDRRPRSDFSRSRFGFVDWLLEFLFRSESWWLDRGKGPPFGVSAMLICRRPQRSSN
jgi:SAM-dependent methyltransferase